MLRARAGWLGADLRRFRAGMRAAHQWPGHERLGAAVKAPVPQRCDNGEMNVQRILVPVGGVALVALGYHYAGWPGVALSAGALVMWVLLHFTRLIRVLQRAGRRPIGYLDSAVMLNAKLKRGMTLMHVIAMTRSLGQLQSEKDAQPEVFRWTDPSDSWVECVFDGGRLVRHEMYRPPAPPEPLEPPASGEGSAPT